MSDGSMALLRQRRVSEGLRLYARLLIEHERVRRLAGSGARTCLPHPLAFAAVRHVAFFQGSDRRAAPLHSFCSGYVDRKDAPPSVDVQPYLAALAAGLDLAGDGIVIGGAEPPWGAANPRAPQTVEDFEAVVRRLRDLDGLTDRPGELTAILAADFPPMPPAEPEAVKVVYDAATFVLDFDGIRVPLPEGRERDLLRALLDDARVGRVLPVIEHAHDWKPAVDSLRRRIRRATGQMLLHAVVLSAKGPVGGYRLNPNLQVIGGREAGLAFVDPEHLKTLASPRPHRRPRRDADDD